MAKIDFFEDSNNNNKKELRHNEQQSVNSQGVKEYAKSQKEVSDIAFSSGNDNPGQYSVERYNAYKKKHKKLLARLCTALIFMLCVAIAVSGFLWVELGATKSALKESKNRLGEISSQNSNLVLKNEQYESQIKVNNKLKAGEELDNSDKTVYLTFDDGPSENTPKILDILDRYNVKATFFVTDGGKYNHYMKDIVDRGHTIALHTYSHNYSKIYKSTDAYFADLKDISDLVKEQTGVDTKIARFPGGTSNTVSARYSKGIMDRLKKQVTSKGYYYFDWNVDSSDATGNNIAVEDIIRGATTGIKYSSDTLIVLMHDTNAKDTTVEALPNIIEKYRSAGIKFSAINELTPPIVFKANN